MSGLGDPSAGLQGLQGGVPQPLPPPGSTQAQQTSLSQQSGLSSLSSQQQSILPPHPSLMLTQSLFPPLTLAQTQLPPLTSAQTQLLPHTVAQIHHPVPSFLPSSLHPRFTSMAASLPAGAPQEQLDRIARGLLNDSALASSLQVPGPLVGQLSTVVPLEVRGMYEATLASYGSAAAELTSTDRQEIIEKLLQVLQTRSPPKETGHSIVSSGFATPTSASSFMIQHEQADHRRGSHVSFPSMISQPGGGATLASTQSSPHQMEGTARATARVEAERQIAQDEEEERKEERQRTAQWAQQQAARAARLGIDDMGTAIGGRPDTPGPSFLSGIGACQWEQGYFQWNTQAV